MASLRGVNESFLCKKSSEQAISYRSFLKSRRVERWRDEARRHSGHGRWGRWRVLRCDGIASLACGFRVAPQFTGISG